MRTPEQISYIKQMLLDYNGKQVADYENIEALLLDSGAGGAGVNIADYLMEDWRDSQGNSHKGLIDKIESEDYLKLKVIPENILPRYIKASCVLKYPINEQEFLPSIISGGMPNASRWRVDKIEPFGDKFKVYFGIDPKSYRYLYTDAYWLIVKNEYVKVNIDANPFADEYIHAAS